MATTYEHVPVLLEEVVAALAPRDGGVYVDGTFGRGGYARAILAAADCTVWGIDRDPAAVAAGSALAEEFPRRLNVIEGPFGRMDALLREAGVEEVDGVTLDLGVSSPQIDDPARGFSFRADGPLDMRMGNHGMTAADAVNSLGETELADVIYRLGEERMSRRVARAIVAARAEEPIDRTARLADIVRRVVPKSRDGIDPATRTFQALRLYVNDELGELDRGLAASERLLRPGGRLAVVSFHSLEDRQVKEFLRRRSGNSPAPSRHAPVERTAEAAPTFRLISRKPVTPGDTELVNNPRARSARLRAAERTKAPAFEEAA
ncbi:16S rRNA (cytosine(1402)-N(4))-methyltransferase RsmH [Skermanella rosea]|uniref:16S rRNA (cytosine(1402)-N(4))-methyltransferase RsmH n=1 Tax=Skermanella rosea TaxID=1817965 RepID=UPI0019312B52|nr:16S rRNA (cytosine(1402)-N(4))-methyltransferase RsmH [Skermanella rosea]UEM02164.1 16S rRNA (cytosine(1402)-N(4))-methyltransferase RsmH [Skermanella rosea]